MISLISAVPDNFNFVGLIAGFGNESVTTISGIVSIIEKASYPL